MSVRPIRLQDALAVIVRRCAGRGGFIVDDDGLPLLFGGVDERLAVAASVFADAHAETVATNCLPERGGVLVETASNAVLRMFWLDTEWGRYGAGVLIDLPETHHPTDELRKILRHSLAPNAGHDANTERGAE